MQSSVACISVGQLFLTGARIFRVAWRVACPAFIGLCTHTPIQTFSSANTTGNLYAHLVCGSQQIPEGPLLADKGCSLYQTSPVVKVFAFKHLPACLSSAVP